MGQFVDLMEYVRDNLTLIECVILTYVIFFTQMANPAKTVLITTGSMSNCILKREKIFFPEVLSNNLCILPLAA